MSAEPTNRGQNGVVISRRAVASAGYRTYEIHQRERVGESTALVKPLQFVSAEFALDPYPLLGILRENYPCYLNWATNSYWLTRYNDVTSVFADDANFETRSKLWFYGQPDFGRNFGAHIDVLRSHEKSFDGSVKPISEKIVGELLSAGGGDLALDFAARLPLDLLVGWLDIPSDRVSWFVECYLTIQRGHYWDTQAQSDGLVALNELATYFESLLKQRIDSTNSDLISTFVQIRRSDTSVSGADIATTLLEWDHETLHGALANLWYRLLTEPNSLAQVRADPRLMKFAYLECLRHSAPVLSAKRFARHEVERFGRLLPAGALVLCVAAAANRDPRIFKDPDRFIVGRKDLCQREPRGQYRADGLASGIAFGLGAPTKHPALPEDRPRSLYAITRDTAVAASATLLAMTKEIRVNGNAQAPRCLRLQEMHACWNLPVTLS